MPDLQHIVPRCRLFLEQVHEGIDELWQEMYDKKGFTTPELNASALSRLKQQLPEGCDSGYSNSRACEIGLSRHSGIPYRSIL